MTATHPSSDRAAAAPARYEYLDALRGWAIVGVLAVHCAVQVGGAFAGSDAAISGRYGVQLFFMISACTIFLTLDRARSQGQPAWTEFFVRRFFRILPMFWVGLALYAFVPGRAPEDTVRAFSPLDYGLTAVLQHGWHPAIINALVPGGWSIAVEGTFYLLTPFFYRLVRSWQAALWLLLGSLALSEAAYQMLALGYEEHRLFAGTPVSQMQTYVYAWFPAQLPVFACGLLAYHLGVLLEKQPWSKRDGALLLACAGVLLLAAINIGQHGWITQHVFFALGFLPFMLGVRLCPARLLVNPFTRLLGRVSYSAYLLHFALLHAATALLVRYVPTVWRGRDGAAFGLLFVTTLALTLPIAWLTYRGVEQPCIRLGGKLIRWLRTRREAAREPEEALWRGAPAER